MLAKLPPARPHPGSDGPARRAYGKAPQRHEVDTEQMDIAQAHLAAPVEAAKRRVLQRERELAEAAAHADVDACVTH